MWFWRRGVQSGEVSRCQQTCVGDGQSQSATGVTHLDGKRRKGKKSKMKRSQYSFLLSFPRSCVDYICTDAGGCKDENFGLSKGP